VAADLPRPDVTVNPRNDAGQTDVVISRDGKCRAFRSESASTENIIRDLVEQIIADPHTAEWIPRK